MKVVISPDLDEGFKFWNKLHILGLLYHDQCFEPAPEVKEALRRLNLKEPWLFDERKIRLYHAHTMKAHGEQLPREKWTKWEDVNFFFSKNMLYVLVFSMIRGLCQLVVAYDKSVKTRTISKSFLESKAA